MDMEIDASLPQLKKQGRFHALRHISPFGLITYEKRLFEGDNTVRNQVILRYLNAEAEAQREPSPAVTPATNARSTGTRAHRRYTGASSTTIKYVGKKTPSAATHAPTRPATR